MRISLTTLLAMLFFSMNLFANDSTARIGAGGVILLKNENIRMLEEVLVISPKIIRVNYKFLNEGKEDIRTTVAFPMPPYGWNPGESQIDSNVGPLRSFKLLLDGATIPTKLSQRALVGNRDITDQLRKAGLTEDQIFKTFGDCEVDAGMISCDLTKKQKAEIARIVHNKDGFSDWKVAETAYWNQVFPAGKTIAVQHEYHPFVGMTYNNPYGQDEEPMRELPTAAWIGPEPKNAENEACLDDETRAAMYKRMKGIVEKGKKYVWATLNDVEYILGTGRNWKGPIKNFKLQIVKESPDQFVSLCFPGKPKKTSPTTLEFSQSNYLPQDKLIVHFYTISGTSD